MLSRLLFSTRCSACGGPGEALCHRCRFALASVGPVRGPDGIGAAFPFDGVPRELIVALKFRHRRAAAGVLAAQMVRRLGLTPVDVVTWAPTSAHRVRSRGYDQAEAIAQRGRPPARRSLPTAALPGPWRSADGQVACRPPRRPLVSRQAASRRSRRAGHRRCRHHRGNVAYSRSGVAFCRRRSGRARCSSEHPAARL